MTSVRWRLSTASMTPLRCNISERAITTARRRTSASTFGSMWSLVYLMIATWALLLSKANAVSHEYDNCLPESYRDADFEPLQFTPRHVTVRLNESQPTRTFDVTIYGNVSGRNDANPYPPFNDPSWTNPNVTANKIVDIADPNAPERTATTLRPSSNVLTFHEYRADLRLCDYVRNPESDSDSPCPIAPDFTGNETYFDLNTLPSFSVSLPLDGSYVFTTLASKYQIISGASDKATLGCIDVNITSDLGNLVSSVLTFVPAAILALVGAATIFAAMFSPWGTLDIFRWTSNYGRDEDQLRLVTPGFGDCLQYIQFIVLAGSLTLKYPGFYQPVVSQVAWSIPSFNNSFVSHGDGYTSLVDGIYSVDADYGLSRLRQYVGPSEDQDLWAGMAVYLVGVVLAVIILSQIGFALRWGFRAISNIQDGDLRNKNIPFTMGNVFRIIFNYFLLPIVALSTFQLVIAANSRPYIVATAVLLLVIVILVASWIFRLIFMTRPRAHLFDDLATVLLYGPLYNTYSDDAAPFAFIPVLLTFIRGVAIGAVQRSGIAQLVVLAICEVIFILTLHAFRPFQAPTSMNAYHTFFSVVRLITVLLSVAFVPSLAVAESSKGWIGYVVLFLHSLVLIFGFFLNALQTIIEVAARLAGAGGEARGGLASVFGKRDLSKRGHRRNQRSSLGSQAAMLAASPDHRSVGHDARTRSLSASSAILLGGGASSGYDQSFSQAGDFSTPGRASPGPATPGGAYSAIPDGSASIGASTRRPTFGSRPGEAMDPYYRPPRMRRPTLETPPGVENADPWAGTDQANKPYKDSVDPNALGDTGEDTLAPAYLRVGREDSDTNLAERLRNTDYTVRESDFYYGVSRGPALSNTPAPRRLKTGPADPTGPVASTASWLKGLFAGNKKEKGKGFEVVRHTRAPLQMTPLDEVVSPSEQEPYRDSPEATPDQSLPGAAMRHGQTVGKEASHEGERDLQDVQLNEANSSTPALAPIESVGGIDMPSRWGSQASSRHPRATDLIDKDIPDIPRKSSKRTPSADAAFLAQVARMGQAPPNLAGPHLHPNNSGAGLQISMPFRSTEPSPSPEPSIERGVSSASSYRQGAAEDLTDPPISPIEDPLDGSRLPRLESNRPVSTGTVQHHVASESIHPGLPRLQSHLSDSAEVIEEGSLSRGRSTAEH